MGDINSFALQQAEAAAAKLWALGSAPFPFATAAAGVIQSHIDWLVTDTAIDFAIHVRRILDNLAFPLGSRSMNSFGIGLNIACRE
jgi:hypothetical protein